MTDEDKAEWAAWSQYSAKRTKQFGEHGMQWPGTPKIDGKPSLLVCCAIMEQSRGK